MSSQVHDVDQSALSSYLNDHLAGSKAAIELVENLAEESAGTPLGELMARLGTEIEADRETLESVMDGLGVESSAVKQAGGWMLEKLSRARFAATRSAAASRLLQIETLSVGIEGKRLLWKALQHLKASGPGPGPFADFDFDRLIARAESQRSAVEPFRLAAAAEGLAA